MSCEQAPPNLALPNQVVIHQLQPQAGVAMGRWLRHQPGPCASAQRLQMRLVRRPQAACAE